MQKRIRNNFTKFFAQLRRADGGSDDGQHHDDVMAISATLDALHHMYGPKRLLGALATTLDGNGQDYEEQHAASRVMGAAVRYPTWRSAFAEDYQKLHLDRRRYLVLDPRRK